jgi:diaminohydroxyphosphoribosylaminopyrimidine deaminase/5-amino-6-(5-phosphoribosylamino)uracil reductase
VLVEGGGRVLGEAFDRRLINRVVFYMAPVFLGGPVPAVGGRGVSAPEFAPSLEEVEYRTLGPDIRISGKVVYPPKIAKASP